MLWIIVGKHFKWSKIMATKIYFNTINIVIFTCSIFFMAGCKTTGTAADIGNENIQTAKQEEPKPVAVAEPAADEPVRQAPILRTPQQNNNEGCSVNEEDDGSLMVISDKKDWFLYIKESAKVDCSSFGGNATITDGHLTITIKALIPNSDSTANMERLLREQAVKHIKARLEKEYRTGSQLKFESKKLGRFKRPALCVNADLDMNGTAGKIAACVTSKLNINDEVVIHRAVWTGPVSDYDEKLTFKQVKKAAASWFRYSDTNTMGKIIHKW
jgi:hypothetical protein